MTVGGILEYDPDNKTHRLPAEHAAFLTRAAGPDNLAFFTQYFPLLAGVEERIIHSFRNGGGVPYSAYPNFQALQAEETARVYDATLIDVTLPLILGIVDRLNSGIDVADIGCGQGRAVNVMARAFPSSRFVGLDFSEEGIAAARREAHEWRLSNARFEVQDVGNLDSDVQFDFITAFDAIHDQANPRRVLANINRALQPDGVFLMVDIAASSNLEENLEHPLGALIYAWSTLHCMTVSLAQGGEGLGTAWGEQKARELLTEAGFTSIEAKQVPGDIINNYLIVKKD
jgi:ubiquinone/menaquinone biosynthesis C-methylase UbiE